MPLGFSGADLETQLRGLFNKSPLTDSDIQDILESFPDEGAETPVMKRLRATPREHFVALGLGQVHSVLLEMAEGEDDGEEEMVSTIGPNHEESALTAAQALARAKEEGLALSMAKNQSGFFGVSVDWSKPKQPFKAQISRGGKRVHLGYFVTAEEAALHVALVERDIPVHGDGEGGDADESMVFQKPGRRGSSKGAWKQKLEMLRKWMEVEPGSGKWPRKASKRAGAPESKSLEARLQSFVQTQRESHAAGTMQPWKAEMLQSFSWWQWRLRSRAGPTDALADTSVSVGVVVSDAVAVTAVGATVVTSLVEPLEASAVASI